MIVVESPRHSRCFCPVECVVPYSPEELEGRALLDEETGTPVAYQAERAEGGARIFWILDSMAARQRKIYSLTEMNEQPSFSGVAIGPEEDATLPVTVGRNHFTTYHFGRFLPRPFLYPVLGPFGAGVTRNYPMNSSEADSADRPHQRSIWMGWGDVAGVDFWSEGEDTGRVVHTCFEKYHSGPVFGRIAALHSWKGPDGNELMQDRTEYRFYNLPGSMRMFDVYVTLYPARDQVFLNDTPKGGVLCVRMATALGVNHGGCITNTVGQVNEAETWGQRAAWCDYSGQAGGQWVGLSVLDHPSNFRYPTYWNVRDYGLMAANPLGLSAFLGSDRADGSVVLPEGDSLRFQYRVYVHAGDSSDAEVHRKYVDWVSPPQARVEQS